MFVPSQWGQQTWMSTSNIPPNLARSHCFYIKLYQHTFLYSTKIFNNKFAWQVGIGAFSISESQVPIIRKYIDNQKTHHKKMTFEEEYRKFIKLYGLDEFSGAEEAEEE